MKCEAQFISKDNDVSGIGLFKPCAIAEGGTKVKVQVERDEEEECERRGRGVAGRGTG